MPTYIFSFLFIFVLTACSTLRLADFNNDRWSYASSLPLNGSGYFVNEIGADFFRSRTQLNMEGQNHLTTFLTQIGLASFKSLRELGGTMNGNSKLCHLFYAQYNIKAENKRDDQRCGSEDLEETKYSWPLVFNLQQFDDYLILYIGEEGLNAPAFYFYSYNIKTGNISSIDMEFINAHLLANIAYKNGKLHFFNYNTEGYDIGDEYPIEKIAVLDLDTGILSISNDTEK